MKKIIVFTFIALIPLMTGCALSKKDSIESPLTQVEQAATLKDGTYVVDAEASTLYWKAYKPVGGHMGGINLERGELIVQGGLPQSGSFVIDMTSITNTDLKNESMNKSLVNHLKSDDFFGTADFPTARFDITKVTPYAGEEDYDYTIDGDLSIKDVTDAVTMLARLDKAGGERLNAYVVTDIDRTKYGITIRSGSFFEELGVQLIKDEFTLEMDLVADRVQEDL